MSTLQDVYREVRAIRQEMISKDELERVVETLELLHNPATMRQVQASERDIRARRTRAVRNVQDMLDELDA